MRAGLVWFFGLILTVWAALPVGAQGLGAALEEELLSLLGDGSERYYDRAEDIIIGWGQGGRIDARGVEDMIAVQLAGLRAGHFRRLHLADLDNDGAVTRAEVGTVMPTLTARLRARLVRLHQDADTDANGIVTAGELRDFAEARARASLGPAEIQNARRVLLLDLDRDGWVTLDELQKVRALSG